MLAYWIFLQQHPNLQVHCCTHLCYMLLDAVIKRNLTKLTTKSRVADTSGQYSLPLYYCVPVWRSLKQSFSSIRRHLSAPFPLPPFSAACEIHSINVFSFFLIVLKVFVGLKAVCLFLLLYFCSTFLYIMSNYWPCSFKMYHCCVL